MCSKPKWKMLWKLYVEGRQHSEPFLLGCFPGNEIPNWYSFQNMGSSITLKLLPDLMNYKSIVFDMCIVVTSQQHHVDSREVHFRWGFMIKDEHGRLMAYLIGPFSANSVIGNRYLSLDHVFMMSTSLENKWNELGNASSVVIDFSVYRCGMEYYEHKVKKCGVNLFYEKAEKEESTYVFSTKEKEEGKEEQQV
ncbi:hypothetical protein Patl1_05353 [Pistacia atlantica]|uniref:Uncharacterized protein n=1 Tax=Pistacia atlantica TaxID=434234 RepID=A0ACC1BPU1_9ROSI|nr:hypothetical protein Patl1_05353 [Pistacia atlantica]